MNSSTNRPFTNTDGQDLTAYRQLASVMGYVLGGQRSAGRVSAVLQTIISDDDIVVVPKVTAAATGKIFHITGNARSAKEAIGALNCPVKWGLAETPEKIPMIIQPVDCRARAIPLGQIRTTGEIYKFYPKILSPVEFFAFGAKFLDQQREAPYLSVWLDTLGRFWCAILGVHGDGRRDVVVRLDRPGGEWSEGCRVLVRE